MTDYKTDLTILGASIPAVVAAIQAKRSGLRVLMLNAYGFPGGPVTENLGCHLNKPELNMGTPVTREIFELLTSTDRCVLFEDESTILLDPECVKYQLQEKLLAEEIELLWHVAPFKVKTEGDKLIEVGSLAKEGILRIKSDYWIDTSTRLDLFHKLGSEFESCRDLYYCFFYVHDRPADSQIPDLKQISLSVNRYWIQIHKKISEQEEPVIIGQNMVNEMHRNLNGRIELVPAEPYANLTLKLPVKRQLQNIRAITTGDRTFPVFGGDFLLAAAFERSAL